uniref:Uncharacterized protein n=1 Tax=Solanum tuberosum TaxID=4113 RepID=M1DJ75_SOLTU
MDSRNRKGKKGDGKGKLGNCRYGIQNNINGGKRKRSQGTSLMHWAVWMLIGMRSLHKGMEIGTTLWGTRLDQQKKWVEEVFNGKEGRGESCINKKLADNEGLRTDEKINNIVIVTSQTVDKDANEEREKKDKGSKVGNIGTRLSEGLEHEGSSNFFEERFNELQDLTKEENQHRRDTNNFERSTTGS